VCIMNQLPGTGFMQPLQTNVVHIKLFITANSCVICYYKYLYSYSIKTVHNNSRYCTGRIEIMRLHFIQCPTGVGWKDNWPVKI